MSPKPDPLDVPHTTSCGHTWTMRATACPECLVALREERGALRAEVARLRTAILTHCKKHTGIGADVTMADRALWVALTVPK